MPLHAYERIAYSFGSWNYTKSNETLSLSVNGASARAASFREGVGFIRLYMIPRTFFYMCVQAAYTGRVRKKRTH